MSDVVKDVVVEVEGATFGPLPHRKPIYVCPICGKEFKQEKRFKDHLDDHFAKDQIESMKSVFKFHGTPPKEVVEALLVDTLGEIFKTFAVTHESASQKMTQEESFFVATTITLEFLELINDCLLPCNNATLMPKHRTVKKIVPIWFTIISTLAETVNRYSSSADMAPLAKIIVDIMASFHKIMHEDTKQEIREYVFRRWEEELNETAAQS